MLPCSEHLCKWDVASRLFITCHLKLDFKADHTLSKGWSRWPLKVSSNLKHSVILRFWHISLQVGEKKKVFSKCTGWKVRGKKKWGVYVWCLNILPEKYFLKFWHFLSSSSLKWYSPFISMLLGEVYCRVACYCKGLHVLCTIRACCTRHRLTLSPFELLQLLTLASSFISGQTFHEKSQQTS